MEGAARPRCPSIAMTIQKQLNQSRFCFRFSIISLIIVVAIVDAAEVMSKQHGMSRAQP